MTVNVTHNPGGLADCGDDTSKGPTGTIDEVRMWTMDLELDDSVELLFSFLVFKKRLWLHKNDFVLRKDTLSI